MRTEFVLDEYQLKIIYALLLEDKYKVGINEFQDLINPKRSRVDYSFDKEAPSAGTSVSYIINNINDYYRWNKFRDDRAFKLDRDDVRTILSMLEDKENKTEDEETLFQILFLSFKF